jgi:hypothetical protein
MRFWQKHSPNCDFFGTPHNRNRALCRALTAHGKGTKTHGTAFVVRLFPKRTAKGARLIFTR